MRKNKQKNLINLLVAMTFLIVAISGFVAFICPFSITIIGLHLLMGFVFVLLIGIHVKHNFKGLKRSLNTTTTSVAFLFVLGLTIFFIWQPPPVRAILSLSQNVGVALDLFEINDHGMVYQYSPTDNYKMKLNVRGGMNYDANSPPDVAIWIENGSSYHIKTLLSGSSEKQLPYWSWKVKEYEKAKMEALEKGIKIEEVDGVTSATTNASFDPRDYILPERNTEPFFILIEVNQPNDPNEDYQDQPSIVFQVEIDNQYPMAFQLFEILGYSKYDEKNKECAIYYPDKTLSSCLQLINCALLTISRGE
jgi:hypothetical protein